MTLRHLAETLRLSVWEAHDILRAEGIASAQGSVEETQASLQEALAEISAEASAP
jgi:hypothetical protein